MQKIDEAKVERIAKNIVGMRFQTSIISYDEINDVRSPLPFHLELPDPLLNCLLFHQQFRQAVLQQAQFTVKGIHHCPFH